MSKTTTTKKHKPTKKMKEKINQMPSWYVMKITYILWEGKGGDRVSEGVCTLQAQSHTYCGKAKVVTGSVRGSALCKHNHIQSVGRQRW
jgi:hypothetical protein